MKRTLRVFGAIVILSAVLVLMAGCGSKEQSPVAAIGARSHDAHDHEHAKGVKALGDYHARIVVEQGGTLKLFMLGKDESKVASIEVQEIKGTLRAADAAEAVPITLQADPQLGDPAGKTSQFVGTVPESLRGQALIADFRILIAGEAYRPTFDSVPGASHAEGHGMPKGVSRGGAEISQEERDLYLTPGGIYTATDIAANGNTVPSVRFQGLRWPHEDNLKPGDKLCPVTDNKADLRCEWVVNGKKYLFCCPPCLDKFITWAKEQPHKVKDPSAYVYKE
jgi:hypothetical protein